MTSAAPAEPAVAVPTAADVVLVVDEEPSSREVMVRWLDAAAYDTRVASDETQALEMFECSPVPVVLWHAPASGHDRLRLVEHLRRKYPNTAVIVASGVQNIGSAATSLGLGVVDYLMEPFGRERFEAAIRRAFEWHETAVLERTNTRRLQAEVERRRDRLVTALNSLKIDSRDTLDDALGFLSASDPSLLEHGRRVADLAYLLARELGLSHQAADVLERAALVHDLPKLAFPASIAGKGRQLLPMEREVIRLSPEFGHQLLASIDGLKETAEIVRDRYEWWDGSGYPRGLCGDAIPLESRILAVADTFDTLLQARRYRPALDEAAAVTEILRCRGAQFDPVVVDTFRRTHLRRTLPLHAA